MALRGGGGGSGRQRETPPLRDAVQSSSAPLYFAVVVNFQQFPPAGLQLPWDAAENLFGPRHRGKCMCCANDNAT